MGTRGWLLTGVLTSLCSIGWTQPLFQAPRSPDLDETIQHVRFSLGAGFSKTLAANGEALVELPVLIDRPDLALGGRLVFIAGGDCRVPTPSGAEERAAGPLLIPGEVCGGFERQLDATALKRSGVSVEISIDPDSEGYLFAAVVPPRGIEFAYASMLYHYRNDATGLLIGPPPLPPPAGRQSIDVLGAWLKAHAHAGSGGEPLGDTAPPAPPPEGEPPSDVIPPPSEDSEGTPQSEAPSVSDPEPCAWLGETPDCASGNTDISGTLTFLAPVTGDDYPVQGACVSLWNPAAAGDPPLCVTTTDDDGNYTMSLTDEVARRLVDTTGPGFDPMLIASSSGTYANVATCMTWGTANPYYCIAEGPPFARTASIVIDPGASHTANLEVSETISAAAFSVYQALHAGSAAVARLIDSSGDRSDPGTVGPVHAIYPKASYGSRYRTVAKRIEISVGDAADWDIVLHEFGHYLQYNELGYSAVMGGDHAWSANLCTGNRYCEAGDAPCTRYTDFDHGKEHGTILAWAEGWSSYFSVALQERIDDRYHALPRVADVVYENDQEIENWHGVDVEHRCVYPTTNPLGAASDPSAPCTSLRFPGEGNELAIMRMLWDLTDSGDSDDDTVAMGAEPILDIVREHRPLRFSSFYQQLVAPSIAGGDMATLSGIGEILLLQGVGANVHHREGPGGDRIHLDMFPTFRCLEPCPAPCSAVPSDFCGDEDEQGLSAQIMFSEGGGVLAMHDAPPLWLASFGAVAFWPATIELGDSVNAFAVGMCDTTEPTTGPYWSPQMVLSKADGTGITAPGNP